MFLSLLVLFLLPSLPIRHAQAQPAPGTNLGKRVALLVGNNDYKPGTGKNDWKPLTNAVNDVRALGKRLVELGFDVKVRENLTNDQLVAEVNDLIKRGQGAQAVFFYFAGHGAGIDNGVNYLMPVDAKPVDESYVNIRNSGLKLEAVFKALHGIKGGTKIILLDACRDEPVYLRSLGSSLSFIHNYAPPDDTVIGFATQSGSKAGDGFGVNSPYASGLLKALSGPQLSLAKVLSVASQETKRINSAQRPANYADQDTLDNFWFAIPASATAAAPAIAATTPPQTAPPANPALTNPRQLPKFDSSRNLPEADWGGRRESEFAPPRRF